MQQRHGLTMLEKPPPHPEVSPYLGHSVPEHYPRVKCLSPLSLKCPCGHSTEWWVSKVAMARVRATVATVSEGGVSHPA